MPIFNYEAKTKHGGIKKGKIEAADKSAVVAALMDMNYYPIVIKPQGSAGMNIDLAEISSIKIREISIFCRQFSYTVASGISILRAIGILKEQTEHPKLKKILSNVYDDVQKGEDLSASMRKHKDFPSMLINMISVGELSGTLDDIMLRMADYYDKEYKLSQKIKQALTYPILVCIFAIIVVTVLIVKVIPIFAGMIITNGGTNADLPVPTKIVMGLSDGIRNHWVLILAVLITLIAMFNIFVKRAQSEGWDKFKISMPVVGKVISKIVTSKFARTFSILIASGLPIVQSLDICSDVVGNIYVKRILKKAGDEIQKGISLAETLEKERIFPPMLISMIRIGEESGTLDGVLAKTSEFYDGEVETATAQLTTMLEPLIIVILAVVVGFIILAMIMPMFKMYDTMM